MFRPTVFRRKAAVWGAAALVALMVVLLLSVRQVAAVDETKCKAALQIQSDPAAAAFKQCAGVSPIPASCCIKMLAFVQFTDCLQDPKYKQVADSFLAPQVTVDRALKECLGR